MNDIIKEICNFIINNINQEIKIEELEKKFYYNKYYIIREFKKITGNTIKEFTNKVKVLKTIDPLVYTDDTILKIALNHGFNSQEYYSETFKNTIGISPIKFRKQYKLKEQKEYLIYLKEYQNKLMKNDIKTLRKVI